MKIAILGAGNVGSSLGAGFARAGHDVVYGVRHPETKSGIDGTVLSLNDAVLASDVIVNGMPGEATSAVLQSLDAGALDGKVLIDPTTAVTERYELLYPNSSLAEKLQETFPTLRVVKTLNTMSAPVMADPGALSAPTTVFLSGNDTEAKRIVADLLVDLGWPTDNHFDLGDVTTARGTEHYLPLFMAIFQATGTDEFGINLVQPPQAARLDRDRNDE